MLKKTNQILRKKARLFGAILATLFLFGLTGYAQTTETQPAPTPEMTTVKSAAVVLQPVLIEYKAVKIGTTADEVRDKLGKARIDDKDGFFYRFSDEEVAQIRLDKDKKVRVLVVTYSGENAPKFSDVFGTEMKEEAKPDGAVYKLVRYPEADYWVAYSRTAGEKPTVTVTMQKMRKVK